MRTLTSNFAFAWTLTLSPFFLFIPAFLLAGMGPCSFSHPLVIVAAFLAFIVFEIAAFPCFVRSARSSGRVTGAMIGICLAFLLLVLSIAFEYNAVSDYWADQQFSENVNGNRKILLAP